MRNFFFAFTLPVILLLTWANICAQDEAGDFDYYKKLNDNETRLSEYKDDDTALRMKIWQVELINQSRARFKAGKLKLDILASRVANKQCREAAEHGYLSHWNLAGEKPYIRYAKSGGLDHVSENAYSQGSSDEINPGSVSDLMKEGHGSFMKERAPYDGHKKNVINKYHNYVGLGFYLKSGEFRYNEEYVDRYLEFINVPDEMKVGEPEFITVDTRGKCYLYFMTVYREDLPKPMTVRQLSGTGSYPDYSDEIAVNAAPWDLRKYRDGSVYKIPLSFRKEGLYYVQIFTDSKEITGYGSVTTKGKEPVSGVVIKVIR